MLTLRASRLNTLLVVFVMVVLLFIPTPSYAHSGHQLDEFVDDWTGRVSEQGLQWELVLEYLDMAERHPWYFQYQEPPSPAPSNPLVTSPSTSTPATSRNMGSNSEQWRGLVAAYFPANQVDMAICIIRYESGGNPDAKNPRSSARGLFQILASLWAPYYGVSYDDLYNPEINTRIAAGIWGDHGWGAWNAARKC